MRIDEAKRFGGVKLEDQFIVVGHTEHPVYGRMRVLITIYDKMYYWVHLDNLEAELHFIVEDKPSFDLKPSGKDIPFINIDKMFQASIKDFYGEHN